MNIHHGSSRIVITFGNLAFKFPKIRILRPLKDVYGICSNQSVYRFSLLRGYLTQDINASSCPGPLYYLFYGIVSNWREWRFWVKHRHTFCEPTHFSLLGLVNLQRVASGLNTANEKFWEEMKQVKGYDWADGHHFSNPKNFSLRGKKLCIVDYGSPETQVAILRHGEAIQAHFSNFKI